MDEIKLMKGGRKVAFKKVPNHFAVRLRQGQATTEAALAASTNRLRAEASYRRSSQ